MPKRLNILVTCGATREPIDPVRFISNNSTGFFGYEFVRVAKERGHRVILIAGKTAFAKPKGITLLEVGTAVQMQQELKDRFAWCDCLVMAAAVSDFRLRRAAKRKIKRVRGKNIALELIPNPDILAHLGQRKGDKRLVGFALETENLKRNAWRKLRAKNLDLIVATPIKPDSYPFGRVLLDALIIGVGGYQRQVKQVSKRRLARILLDRIEKTLV